MRNAVNLWVLRAFGPLLLVPAALSGQPSAELVDRILAVVDDDPVLASDVDRVIGLGLAERLPEEDGRAYRRRVLDLLIEEKLRFHEIDRFGLAEVPLDELERQYERLRGRFASEQAFRRRLEELGLDEDGVRQLLARQLMVLVYVEERLGPRVFVDLDEIREYYDTVLVPEMKARGEAAPPISSVREGIRRVLIEKRLNEEIERWTDQLRLEADIADYFDGGLEAPPPAAAPSRS